MSDTDTFIDEVSEEVRRDHLFKMMKRYGWIAVLAILLIVGGAAYNEYRKASDQAAAQSLGDSILAALSQNDAQNRIEKLADVSADTPGGRAIVAFLTASALAETGEIEQAVASLGGISLDAEVPEIYRQIANFKALTLQAETMAATERRLQFAALAQPGSRLRLLAEEQLVLIDISEGQIEPALTRLQAMLQDAEIDRTLQRRVEQVIISLGGTPQTRAGVQG